MVADRPQLMERWRIRRQTSADQMRAEASHRRRVEALKWLLPAIALALTSIIGWSWFNPSTTSFHIDYSPQDFELSGQDEMLRPRFVGVDSRQQRYTVTAEVAMRPERGHEEVFLMKPTADITLKDGDWLTLKAEQGIYDRQTEILELHGSVSLYVDNGFEMHTEKAEFDLSQGTARGNQAVLSQSPWGVLTASGFEYSPSGQVFYFSGRPTLVLHAAQTVGFQ